MEKINARKVLGQGRRWRERRIMEEKKFPWQARETEGEKRTSKLTRDGAAEIRAKNARERRTGGAVRLLCKEDVAFFSRVSVRFIPHSKAL